MIMNKYVMPVVSMLCATLLSVPHSASAATDGETSINLGAEYTSGDYGTSSKTKIWYFPVTLRYETDVNAASIAVSYLSVEGRGDVVVSGGGMGMGSQTVKRNSTLTGTRTNSGFGDVILTGSHKLFGTASSRIYITGKIKFGTADETDNLGTGENDYAVQLDFEKDYNSNSVFGSAGYKIFGDPPGTDYKNVFYGSIGFSHKLDAARAAGLTLNAQQAALSGGSGQSDLTLFLSDKLDKKTRLTGYVLKGFGNGSPDWGLGVTLKLIQ
jgi:hypothetical protein